MSNADERAYPVPGLRLPNGNFIHPSAGLTKRELFALQLAAGMCASESDADWSWSDDELAKHAVKRADALLAELAKDGEA